MSDSKSLSLSKGTEEELQPDVDIPAAVPNEAAEEVPMAEIDSNPPSPSPSECDTEPYSTSEWNPIPEIHIEANHSEVEFNQTDEEKEVGEKRKLQRGEK